MSTEALIDILDKLNKLHEKLYDLSVSKTEFIKKGDMEGLQNILKNEQTFVSAIHTMEIKRQEAAAELLGKADASEMTLTNCIAAAPKEYMEKLKAIQTELVTTIDKLKNQNELNQQLVHQSLQFVNMTLDMIQPRPESINYSRPDQQKATKPSVSLFNSKA